MNQSFYRKIAYAAAVILLLFPLLWLGAPSSRGNPGQPDEPGGKLAQLRSEAKLGQADLGAIDPASETIRLATLGLRGMAVNMLWSKANEYKKTEDWTSFQATLDQLARLQPYFVKVWQYQAWNLSYNVSVELDNVRDRFYYVKQGIQYLEQGIQYLRDNPYLLDDLGWFCGNKVGRADEHEQYRRLFKLDDDLHPPSRLPENRDNWLVSKEWYDQAVSAVDDRHQSLGQKNPTTFFDSPARSQISYSEAIEDEGTFGPRAKASWSEGDRLWRAYGNREMPSTQGFLIRLVDQEKWDDLAQKHLNELDALSPGLAVKMKQEALDALTPQQKQLLAKMPAEPTADEQKLYDEANTATDITPEKIASRIAKDIPAKASDAQRLAYEIAAAHERSNSISINRDVCNYEYWQLRCDIEQSPEALQAREKAHEAHRAFQAGDPTGAKKLYEECFDNWSKALAKFPKLTPEGTMGGDIIDFVDAYNGVLQQLDLSLADDEVAKKFPLWKWVEVNDSERKYADAIGRQHAREGHPDKPEPSPQDKDKKEAAPVINPADAETATPTAGKTP